MVRLLLDNEADINALDKHNNSVLHIAMLIGNMEMIRLLLERGIDIDVENNQGDSFAHYASGHT